MKNNCFINSILQSMAASQSLVTWLNCANITARQNGKLIQQIATLINSKSADLQMMKSVDEQSLFHIAQILPGLATCRERERVHLY